MALAAGLRKEKHSPTLVAATISQLGPRGVDMTLVEWNTWREIDGSWNILLLYPTKDGSSNEANWSFDLANRSLEALDDGAAWISGEELDSKSGSPTHGIVYPSQTPAPRLVAVRAIEETYDEDKSDGVTKRLKIPSWDDIMFGNSKEPSEEE
ncbi:MAG: septation protein SepH [Actinomycetota bacterium]